MGDDRSAGYLTAMVGSFVESVGILKTIDYLNRVDSVRDAIYSKAPEINSTVIQAADAATKQVDIGALLSGISSMMLGGALLAYTYYLLRKASNVDGGLEKKVK